MIVPFTSSEAVNKEFFAIVTSAAIVVLAMASTAVVASRGKPSTLSIKFVGVIAVLGFILITAIAYQSTFGRFIKAEVNASEVRLLYAGLFGGEVVLPRVAIETVLFGLPGKSHYSCYIRIREKSGYSHRSATLPNPVEDCKTLRTQMLAILSNAAGT